MKTRLATLGLAALALLHAAPAAADYAAVLAPARPRPAARAPHRRAAARAAAVLPDGRPPGPAGLCAGPAGAGAGPHGHRRLRPQDPRSMMACSFARAGWRTARSIPAGGLFYMEDTWAARWRCAASRCPSWAAWRPTSTTTCRSRCGENVTILAGGSAVVGGQVYYYYATVGHETMANHALHVRTIAGTDWEGLRQPRPVGHRDGLVGQPLRAALQPGQASEVTPQKMVFDWLERRAHGPPAVRRGQDPRGPAGAGESWQVGARTVRVAAVDAAAGTVTLELIENGQPVKSRTLGPVQKERLIEDTEARKALVFEDGDMVAFLSPYSTPSRATRPTSRSTARRSACDTARTTRPTRATRAIRWAAPPATTSA